MMSDPENLLKISNEDLEALGCEYRILCAIQGRHVLVRGKNRVPFHKFVQDRMAAAMIREYVSRKQRLKIPNVQELPI